MIQTLGRYLFVLFILAVLGFVITDSILMPYYVQSGESRYLVDVQGRPLEAAIQALENEGFKGMATDVRYTNSLESGTVVDQYPDLNTRVKPGRTIRLTIARPEKMVEVPNLLGQSKRGAELTLQQVGLGIDTVYSEYNPGYPRGTVSWQYPKGGDQVQKGTSIQINVSLGLPPNFYQVPSLFGLSLSKARDKLTSARLKVGKISYQQNVDLVPFTVLAQSVPAETILEKPVPVDLTVSVLDLQDIYQHLTSEQE